MIERCRNSVIGDADYDCENGVCAADYAIVSASAIASGCGFG
jgi:hypothetical protein